MRQVCGIYQCYMVQAFALHVFHCNMWDFFNIVGTDMWFCLLPDNSNSQFFVALPSLTLHFFVPLLLCFSMPSRKTLHCGWAGLAGQDKTFRETDPISATTLCPGLSLAIFMNFSGGMTKCPSLKYRQGQGQEYSFQNIGT